MEEMEKSTKVLLWALSLSVVAVILSTGYKFLVLKDYNFIVEAPCDPTREVCFTRDCSGGDCPPNELENYRIFAVPAGDFPKCADNSCLEECLSGLISCEEIVCGDDSEDECVEAEIVLEQEVIVEAEPAELIDDGIIEVENQ